ncbi:sorcin isoform X4 [Macaca nemestrina]|uniref:sorcin isoform X2 n=1 Tax=Chlorocebus sabaeus TaxID=60711 RepID=UPI0005F4CC0B|nr:sorcin isoform X2 [Chlorocebus sabaeus]XP_011729007.1 sorcin isoform X4 [Macaca nemestrina]XP_014989552.1 sorcin isoform X1 [Macaca mulatta]XP_015302803.1 sorcin isoform X3 [Macaca fascicularis]XP_023082349.1 sorcin isoform X2 [Piliocolobus tephrosceles]XP_033050490.1 sorcin isoform X3 [Trachypithecus francoisi]XP_050641268.1 sorcin isoform X2 [Macaca thibetana thibetana]
MAYPGHPGAGGGYYPGGYGGAPGGPAFPGQTQDPLYGYFAAVAGQDGQIDADELQRCLTQSGIAGGYKRFRLSPQAVNSIAKRYSTNGKITFDDYIACCVKLRALTDSFRRRDTAQQGVVNFPYDDFIQCVMSV